MKIIKVVVDKVPQSCESCPYFDKVIYEKSLDDEKYVVFVKCNLFAYKRLTFEGFGNIRKLLSRPDWCPLVAGKIIPTIRKGYLLIKESEDA